MSMKLITKALAAVGAATLIGPAVGFVAGIAVTFIGNATNPEVSKAMERFKKQFNGDKDEYDEGEAMPSSDDSIDSDAIEYAKKMAEDIQMEMNGK